MQLLLKTRTRGAAQREVHMPALTVGPQQRVLLIHSPDGLTILRKGLFELFSCAYEEGRSAPATVVPRKRVTQTLIRAQQQQR